MRQLVKLKYLLSFSLFLLAVSLSGQEVKFGIALERDSIWLGDQVKLLLMVEQPAGIKISFPQVPDSIRKIEILQKSKIDTSKMDGGKLQLKQTYLITCFDSGAHYIPPFYFRLVNNGVADSAKTRDLTLFVKFPPVDLKKGPVDIKKPFSAPITLKEIAPWLFGIILIGAIVFLIIYALSRYRKNKSLFQRPPKPKLPPHVIALQELEKLKGEQLWQQDKVKDYYTRLTDIVRVYIEDRFGVPAMESTTFEILADFKAGDSHLNAKAFSELQEILELADFVKFAKLTPYPDDNQKMLNNAYLFVNETIPAEINIPVTPAEIEGKDVSVDVLNDKKEEGKL